MTGSPQPGPTFRIGSIFLRHAAGFPTRPPRVKGASCLSSVWLTRTSLVLNWSRDRCTSTIPTNVYFLSIWVRPLCAWRSNKKKKQWQKKSKESCAKKAPHDIIVWSIRAQTRGDDQHQTNTYGEIVQDSAIKKKKKYKIYNERFAREVILQHLGHTLVRQPFDTKRRHEENTIQNAHGEKHTEG